MRVVTDERGPSPHTPKYPSYDHTRRDRRSVGNDPNQLYQGTEATGRATGGAGAWWVSVSAVGVG